MELEEFYSPAISGITGLAIALIITYFVSLVAPTNDLEWALKAVGIASFFSGFFGNYFAGK